MVFIHQPNSYRYEAAQIEAMIALLQDASDGDLHAGFHALLRALARDEQGTAAWYAARLPASVAVSFELRDPHQERHVPGLVEIIIPRVLLLAGQ